MVRKHAPDPVAESVLTTFKVVAALFLVQMGVEMCSYVKGELIPKLKVSHQKRIEKYHNQVSNYLAKRIASYDGNPIYVSSKEIELANGILPEKWAVERTSDPKELESSLNKVPTSHLESASDRLDAYDRVQNKIQVNKLFTRK